jgi:hypothetical protein
MIADNWSPIRDYKLISKIKIPIRIIICGYKSGDELHIQCLDLDRKAG